MAGRRKMDPAKILPKETRNVNDDARPWFLVAHFPPPEWREVAAVWPDGVVCSACIENGKWTNALWCVKGIKRDEPPVGWKPSLMAGNGAELGGHPSGRLPNPREYGLELV